MMKKIVLRDDQMPTQWYNVVPDLPNGLLPPLDPETKQPMGPEKLAPVFPLGLLEQEMSTERFIDIPEEVGPPAPKVLLNSAGVVYGASAWGDKAVGVYYDRDWKFIRYGGELTKNTYAVAGRVGWEVRAKLGVIF